MSNFDYGIKYDLKPLTLCRDHALISNNDDVRQNNHLEPE